MTQLTETEYEYQSSSKSILDTVGSPFSPEAWGSWATRQPKVEAQEDATDVGCANALVRWYEGSSRPTLTALRTASCVPGRKSGIVSDLDNREADVAAWYRSKAPSKSEIVSVVSTHAWKMVPTRVYSDLLNICWNETTDSRDLAAVFCCRDSRIIEQRASIDDDIEGRLVPPAAPVRRIKVRLRSVGREQARIRFDPDQD